MFVFDVGGKAWRYYDWTKVTTIAAFGKYDEELMCFAHSKGVRLVLKGNSDASICKRYRRLTCGPNHYGKHLSEVTKQAQCFKCSLVTPKLTVSHECC